MKYAVISLSGTQYKVSPNDIATINQIDGKEGDKLTTDQVLLIVDEDKVSLGQPTIKNASVDFEIIKNYQGKKIKVFKYKSKSRYHKTQGFRSQLTDIKILDIKTSSTSVTESKKPKSKSKIITKTL